MHQDRTNGTVELDQTEYINTILANYGMLNCRPTCTPMDPIRKPSSPSSPQSAFNPDDFPYQSVVGSLMFLVQATRPDLAYGVGNVSRYNHSHDESHWSMLKRILRYLQGTKDLKIRYSRNFSCHLVGYCDAGGAVDKDNPRYTSGYTFMMCGAAISWSSRRRRLAIELLIIRQNESLVI